ncbi:MAG TPA: (d)CMP kinase [Alphaproteobacteria bacterium]|nr:(d)CMP kinase [Alphaproteobacteria bacterium]
MSAVKIIAIDGPAASGKGTLAKRIAQHYGFAHLDTGALYRAVGLKVLRGGGDPENALTAGDAARALRVEDTEDEEIRGDAAAQAASKVAAIPSVREALLDFQRDFCRQPPGGRAGAVLDGRDIGTVIAPEAPAKIYVEARVEVRAERRVRELQGRGIAVIPDAVLKDLKERDARDSQRAVAPLKPAADAFLLDTSDLTIDQALAAALDFVRSRIGPA